MGFMDKVREQSTQLAQKAQETAREGKVKLDQAQAKRRADAIFRDLGAAVYAERTGRAGVDNKEKIDRLIEALSRQEADQGLGDADTSAPPTYASPPSPSGTVPTPTPTPTPTATTSNPSGTVPTPTPTGTTSPPAGDTPPS
jgi:hypothetical protein